MRRTFFFSFMIALAIAIFGVSAEKVSAASEETRFVKVEVIEMNQPITHYFEKYEKVSEATGYARTYLRHIRPSEKLAQTAYKEAVAVAQGNIRSRIDEAGNEPECYVTISINTVDITSDPVCIRAEDVDLLKINWTEDVNRIIEPKVSLCIFKSYEETGKYDYRCTRKEHNQDKFDAYPFTFEMRRSANPTYYSLEMELNENDFIKGKWYFTSSSYTEYKDGRTYSTWSSDKKPMEYSSIGIGTSRFLWHGILHENKSYTVRSEGSDAQGIFSISYTMSLDTKVPEYEFNELDKG